MKLYFVSGLSLFFGFFTTVNAQCGEEITNNDDRVDITELDRLWAKFKIDNRKKFQDAGEEYIRKHIFADFIHKQNSRFRLRGSKEDIQNSLNRFSDMSDQEFLNRPRCLKLEPRLSPIDPNDTDFHLQSQTIGRGYRFDPNETLPDHIDWTEKGVVTDPKDQGNCEACWAFSAMGAIESQYALRTRHLRTFSEQQLIDCVTNDGCQGPSSPLKAFMYAIEKGIATGDQYPYTQQDESCDLEKVKYLVEFTDFVLLDEGDERSMESALYNIGPLSVAISWNLAFKNHKDGVLTQECGKIGIQDLTHGVLVVGYGTDENGIKYWKLKNSWGENWGMDGYFLMERGVNLCGIALLASVPLF